MKDIYFQEKASPSLQSIIKSFWMVDDPEYGTTQREKIIPDGYTELIFHFGDRYKTNIDGTWLIQDCNLVAGQIRNHFFLENTGASRMFAIKMQPWALAELFDLEMSALTDSVITIPTSLMSMLQPLQQIAVGEQPFHDKVTQAEAWFMQLESFRQYTTSKGQQAAHLMLQKQGQVSLAEIYAEIDISERSLERYFKKHVGLSPKFYLRIIRFSYVFQLIQEEHIDWSDVVFQAGYYDQSHFIKNFKEFTGDDPSKYPFGEKNMANLFLTM